MSQIFTSPYLRLPIASSKLVSLLASLGALWLALNLRALGSFTWTHFLRRGSIKRYKDKTGETWAIVTGASDGLGKGFAQELADQGFEVILHGRNEKKLKDVQSDLQQRWPERKFRLLILDAEADSKDAVKMETEIAKHTHLNIRVLINNVSGGGQHEKPIFAPLAERKAENVNGWIDISARFPTQITRILLPTLIQKQPALIINIGSGISEFGLPYLTTYAGAKAYNKAWSRALSAEMKADGHDVEVFAVIVGEVATERLKREASISRPGPRQMARSCLYASGSGRRVISAYWFHAIQTGLISALPLSMVDMFATSLAWRLRSDEEKERQEMN